MPQETSPWNRRELKRERSEPVARWRGSRSPSYYGGPRCFPRAPDPRRHSGHGKQGGWHLCSEEPGRKFVHARPLNKMVPMHGDGKHSRGNRDNSGLFPQREYRGGQSWETSRGPYSMKLKLSDNGDNPRDQHNKSGANWLSPSQKIEDRRLVDSVDWKPRRWVHSGSSRSRDAGLGQSSGSKSQSCIDSPERKAESRKKSVIRPHSSQENVADCGFLTGQSEELTSKKKPRLGWGEGLAKYEKKVVEGPLDSIMERGKEAKQSVLLDAVAGTSGLLGVLDSSSPATSSSLASGSVSGLEDKLLLETVKMSGHVDNLSDLLVSGSQSAHQGLSANSEKLDMSSFSIVDPSLVQLLHSNGICVGSGFATSLDKLQLVKGDVLKALMVTESEIDLLENERKSFASESRDTGAKGMVYAKGTYVDSHVTATFNKFEKDIHLVNEDAAQGSATEVVKLVSGSRKEETVNPFEPVKFPGCAESALCDLILSSNKECANRASSDLFNNLLLRNYDKLDVAEVGKLCHLQDDSRTKEKFTQRKQFLIFKERILALKFKALHHLWKKDMLVLSLKNSRLKTQKKPELSLRVKLSRCQKPSSSIGPCVSSAGIISLARSKEIISYTSKLLTDSQWGPYREALKMPALVLDEREKVASRFFSYNGLVEDPYAVEKERKMINPWTVEEREIFLEKLGKYGKDFRKIASFLDHKTTADCVEFYYKNHKSEFFQGVKKNHGTGPQPKVHSANTYLVTSGKKRDHEVNAVSLNLLSEASLLASQDHAEVGNCKLGWGSCQGRSVLRPCSSSRSSRVVAPDDEREAVAADVLTAIRGSVVNAESCREEDLSDWTDAEKSIFMQGVSRYGKDFGMISQYLKTRSKDQCRAFFNKARKCLGLDLMLPGPEGKPTNADADAGGGDMDDPCDVNNGPVTCEDNSVADKNQDLPTSVKMETSDAIDCGLSTDLMEGTDGIGLAGGHVHEGLGISPRDHDVPPVNDLNEQVSDQSLRANERWSANLVAESSPCSVFSLSFESKDQSSVETDQDEKPPRAITTGSASFQCAEMKTQSSNHQPESREQESGNPTRAGDFKLFGKRILTCVPSQKIPDPNIEGEDKKGIPKAALNSIASSNRGGNVSSPKFNPDNYAGLENIPIRSYGYWDGTRVRTVPSLPDSALLFSMYPAAFSKHSLQEVAKGSELNPSSSNSHSVIPAWDATLKHRFDAYLEMQRCNGLEAISGQKQQGVSGMAGMSIGARGGFAGGSCTDLSDPVAAIKMLYAPVNQFCGPGVCLTREDSQRDAADMKA